MQKVLVLTNAIVISWMLLLIHVTPLMMISYVKQKLTLCINQNIEMENARLTYVHCEVIWLLIVLKKFLFLCFLYMIMLLTEQFELVSVYFAYLIFWNWFAIYTESFVL